METKDYFHFDLSKRRPKVLIVGNGITRENGLTMDELIQGTCKEGFDVNLFKNNITNGNTNDYALPYTILTMISAPLDDVERRHRYHEILHENNSDITKFYMKTTQTSQKIILTICAL